ncbi:MAG: thioesterase family protein [Bacteroidota bacterium]|nr:thioesterase family protein [Bacteroidota bacterium]
MSLVSHHTAVRVRYADTDQMRIVYNGKYLEYFEVGRTELIRSLGLSYAEIERRGIWLPLIEAHCRYHHPARYDDVLIIGSTVRDVPRASLRIDYEITREGSAAVLVTGYTTHAFFNVEQQRPARPPEFFLRAMGIAFPD